MKSASRWFHYTDILRCTVSRTLNWRLRRPPHNGSAGTLCNCAGACCRRPQFPILDGTQSLLNDNKRINYIYIYIYIYSRVRLEKPTDPQLVKKFPAFYHTPKIHCRINNILSPVPILGQINPVHAPSHILKIHFNILLPSKPA
jgi:hypothetical protein